MEWWPADWSAILVPEAPLAELVVRGTLIYAFLLVMMRIAGRRLLGRFSMTDILVTLLLAVAVRDGLTGPYQTVGDAAVSGAVILGWDIVLDRLAFTSGLARRVLRHGPLKIIEEGELLEDAAKENLLTEAELMEKLRARGVTSVSQVSEAYLEQDGSFTVIRGG